MQIDDATPQAGPPSEFLWLRESGLLRPREDRFTEAIALLALLFSLSVGLVIAMLPVSAKATAATRASREPSEARIVVEASRHTAGGHRAAPGRD